MTQPKWDDFIRLRLDATLSEGEIKDKEFLAAKDEQRKVYDYIHGLNLPEEAMDAIDRYITANNGIWTRYNTLVYRQGFSDCRNALQYLLGAKHL